MRELAEETGYRAGRVEPLITFEPMVSTVKSEQFVYVGREPEWIGEPAGVAVADALGPFVDGVVSGRRDDDRVGFLGSCEGAWWLWWSWADQIAPIDDVSEAAFKIAYVLTPT